MQASDDEGIARCTPILLLHKALHHGAPHRILHLNLALQLHRQLRVAHRLWNRVHLLQLRMQ